MTIVNSMGGTNEGKRGMWKTLGRWNRWLAEVNRRQDDEVRDFLK